MLPLVRRRLAALLALPLAAAVLGAGCAEDVSPAIRVGDVAITDEELMDEVEEWAGNAAAFDPTQLQQLNPGTYPMRLVNVILQQRIDLELHRARFEELDLELTDQLRRSALVQLLGGDEAVADQAIEGFSDDYAEQYLDDIGRQLAVELELGQQGYAQWRLDAYRSTDIDVSPRYGEWDAEAQSVVAPRAPSGPADQSGS